MDASLRTMLRLHLNIVTVNKFIDEDYSTLLCAIKEETVLKRHLLSLNTIVQ